MSAEPVRVLIACPGLGIANRGFERAARDWFEALRDRGEIDLALAKGAGPEGEGERRVPTISREARISRLAAKRLGRHEFWLEQVVFAVSLQPLLARFRPEVVMLSEWALAGALGRLRRVTRGRFRLLLSNGAPGDPPFPVGVDHVQQLTPSLLDRAIAAGVPAERQTLLPYGVRIPREFTPPGDAERAALRRELGIPAKRRVVLSVGALNRWHKRMDYLVREVASLPEPRPFVVMLGAEEPETQSVLAAAVEALGRDGFLARTVARAEVDRYYRAADAFALASGFEGFGLVFAEALANGLPVIAQDSPVMRFVTGEHGRLGDFSRPGALAKLLASASPGDAVEAGGPARHRFAYERFSWDALAPRYSEMLSAVARG